MHLAGAILAGGASRRMGVDKAELVVAGEPLWRRQRRILSAAGVAGVALVRRPGQSVPEGCLCRRDIHRGAGPLAGLHAALSGSAATHIAVLAVDMPKLDAAWFRWLRGFCRPGIGAMARHEEACEPLAAIYPIEALGEITSRLERRDRSLQRLALSLAAQNRLVLLPVPAIMRNRLLSLNKPADA
jgi:molybdopterin-guanine dinucleotide biosynthesis protein A